MPLIRARAFSALFSRYRRPAPTTIEAADTKTASSRRQRWPSGAGAAEYMPPSMARHLADREGDNAGSAGEGGASTHPKSTTPYATKESRPALFSGMMAKYSIAQTRQPGELTNGGEAASRRLRSSAMELSDSSSQTRTSMPQLLTPDIFHHQLSPHIDTFIFDADGVLWLGDEAITGSATLVNHLISAGKHVLVLTNNATKSRAAYATKLHRLGYSAKLSAKNVINPAAVVADLLERAGLTNHGSKRVYLIGEQGLRDELDSARIDHFGSGPESNDVCGACTSPILYNFHTEVPASEVGAVVVGYEKHFNYLKLMRAANYLRQPDCLFVGTNEDETCPGPDPSVLIPDTGPLLAAVRVASGREPLVVGKPQSPAYEYIRRLCCDHEVEPARTLMVGDRLNTDIAFGRRHGMATLLVLSGCHQLEHVGAVGVEDCVPDYYAPSLGALLPPQRLHETTTYGAEQSPLDEMANGHAEEANGSIAVAKKMR